MCVCIYFLFLYLSSSGAAKSGVLSAEWVAGKAPGTLAVSQSGLVLWQPLYNNPQPNTRPHELAALSADGAHLQPLLGWALINENKYFSSATGETLSGGWGVMWCDVVWCGLAFPHVSSPWDIQPNAVFQLSIYSDHSEIWKMRDIDMRQVGALHAYEGVFQENKPTNQKKNKCVSVGWIKLCLEECISWNKFHSQWISGDLSSRSSSVLTSLSLPCLCVEYIPTTSPLDKPFFTHTHDTVQFFFFCLK